MNGEKIAVLDLGTNSFHLLIAKVETHGFEEMIKMKKFVHLASGGINHISEEKFELALSILKEYKEIIDEHDITYFKAFGTASMRNADNSEEFRKVAKQLYGFDIEVIDGDREAELIYKGVRNAVSLDRQPRLIMDIGGGSTEFIIATSKEILWKRSFEIGAGVLRNQFHQHEPISQSEYSNLISFLDKELQPLWWQIKIHKPIGLVGASGSFMSLVNLQRTLNTVYPILEGKSEIVNLSGVRVTHLTMLKSDLEERLAITDLEPSRAPMMTVATTLISLVISYLKPERSIAVSHYSLKEGMLEEMNSKMLLLS